MSEMDMIEHLNYTIILYTVTNSVSICSNACNAHVYSGKINVIFTFVNDNSGFTLGLFFIISVKQTINLYTRPKFMCFKSRVPMAHLKWMTESSNNTNSYHFCVHMKSMMQYTCPRRHIIVTYRIVKDNFIHVYMHAISANADGKYFAGCIARLSSRSSHSKWFC